MRKIVLIGCGAKKQEKKTKAKDLYIGELFKSSLAYGYSLKPDKIFILSALHHLLDLEKEIEPYDVTLSNISKAKRKQGLKVLNAKEKKEWGEKVIKMLSQETDIQNDKIIILAGQEYIKPIKKDIKYLDDRLHGLNRGKRVKYLKSQL